MARESVIENRPFTAEPQATGTITTDVGNDAIVGVGTDFTSISDDTIVQWVDDAGIQRSGVKKSHSDATNMIMYVACVSVSTNVDFFAGGGTFLPTSNYFIADNTKLRMPIISPESDNRMLSVAGLGVFSFNIGCLVKSVYIRLPFQYTMSDSPLTISFSYYTNDGVPSLIGTIDTIGEGGKFTISRENTEIDVNAYVPPPTFPNTPSNWQIGASILGDISNPDSDFDIGTTPSISQVNAPSALNGMVLPITIGMRVVHTDAILLAGT